jgi:hypothetical protein
LLTLAAEIRAAAQPVRAAILEVLPHFSVAELIRWNKTGQVDETRISRVAELMGEPTLYVRNIIKPFLRNDLRDYSAHHEKVRRCFETCGSIKTEVINYCRQELGSCPLSFLLHDLVHVWDATTQNFGIELVEEFDDENLFGDACEGFLVTTGMAFSSSIELLAGSFNGQWQGWQDLWRIDF